MNELTTEYRNSYTIWNSFSYKYFVVKNIEIPARNKTKALVLLKERNK